MSSNKGKYVTLSGHCGGLLYPYSKITLFYSNYLQHPDHKNLFSKYASECPNSATKY